mmetsp:Transcript_59708/g.126448  ORF Transcript_59708/g.126448 Transcript_59708/m.126448 type:complete len:94 (+) Transcript_59708:62-343(+)
MGPWGVGVVFLARDEAGSGLWAGEGAGLRIADDGLVGVMGLVVMKELRQGAALPRQVAFACLRYAGGYPCEVWAFCFRISEALRRLCGGGLFC